MSRIDLPGYGTRTEPKDDTVKYAYSSSEPVPGGWETYLMYEEAYWCHDCTPRGLKGDSLTWLEAGDIPSDAKCRDCECLILEN